MKLTYEQIKFIAKSEDLEPPVSLADEFGEVKQARGAIKSFSF